jgi:hypothetical protein
MAQPKMFEVTVAKPTPDAKLGVLFFLPEADGEAMAYGPTIKSLTPNGLLASTILEAGDKITKVGSEATAGLGSVKTVELLQTATGTFILGVARHSTAREEGDLAARVCSCCYKADPELIVLGMLF